MNFANEQEIKKWANTTFSVKKHEIIQVKKDDLFYYFVQLSDKRWHEIMSSILPYWFAEQE